ncbi:MAG: molybdate ABC transporter substrate-binding protein [Pseudomonadota bacterium]
MIWRFAMAAIAIAAIPSLAEAAERTLVFAAASMRDAVEELARSFAREGGHDIVVSVASSGTLARQIETGAPADIYISADPAWMDYLQARGLILSESRVDVAANTLVAVAQKRGQVAPGTVDRAQVLIAERIAMGDPRHVPAGAYAQQSLVHLGLWQILEPRAVFAENVRVSLALAARGDVDYAIVYGSDARMGKDLDIVYTFASAAHAPIVYPAALTRDAGEKANTFLDYLQSEAARSVFASFGFASVSNVESGD